jgi:hypothetical protein
MCPPYALWPKINRSIDESVNQFTNHQARSPIMKDTISSPKANILSPHWNLKYIANMEVSDVI